MFTQKKFKRYFNIRMTRFLLFFTFVFCILNVSFLVAKNQKDIQLGPVEMKDIKLKTSQEPCCVMTVFIHGTKSFNFMLNSFAGWLKSDFVERIFKKIVQKHFFSNETDHSNKFEFFTSKIDSYINFLELNDICAYQPNGKPGLTAIDLDASIPRDDLRYVGHKIANVYKKNYDSLYPNHKNILEFSSYNWNGMLSNKERLVTSRLLYSELLKEAKRLKEYYKMPVKINLLAHSHGCNVVLNLPDIEEELLQNLYIDKVVFFGAPVQSETEKHICSKIFGKKYNIYSHGDIIQVLDFVSTKDFFSRRIFLANKSSIKALPEDLCQINIEIGQHKPSHYELWLCKKKYLPSLIYSKDFPFNPFPISVFTPFIIYLADEVNVKNDEGRSCKLNFDQDKNEFSLIGGGQKTSHIIDINGLDQYSSNIV